MDVLDGEIAETACGEGQVAFGRPDEVECPFEGRVLDRYENQRVFLVALAGGKQGDAEPGADKGADGRCFVNLAHDARGESRLVAQIIDEAAELVAFF